MNLLFTFQAKPDPAKIQKRDHLRNFTESEISKHQRKFNIKNILPPISLSSSKSARVLPYTAFDRESLKTDIGAPRPKFVQSRAINSSSSSLCNKFNRLELNRICEENEPKTPTFEPDDARFKELVKLNKKIDEEYRVKGEKKKMKKKAGEMEEFSRKFEVKPLQIEVKCKKDKFLAPDFPFFVESGKGVAGSAMSVRGKNEWRQNKAVVVRRRHPKIQKFNPGLPQGVFTVRDL